MIGASLCTWHAFPLTNNQDERGSPHVLHTVDQRTSTPAPPFGVYGARRVSLRTPDRAPNGFDVDCRRCPPPRRRRLCIVELLYVKAILSVHEVQRDLLDQGQIDGTHRTVRSPTLMLL